MRSRVVLAAACLVVLAGSGCDSGPSAPETTTPIVAHVAVTPPIQSATAGALFQLGATVTDSAGLTLSGQTVVWSTSDSTIVRVTPAGLATAVFVGTATVTATVGGHSGNGTVAVIAPVLTQIASGMSGSLGAFSPGFGNTTGYDYGFSFYTSIHVLQDSPVANTQLGWGTWLKPDPTGNPSPPCPDPNATLPNAYQTIEGGAGVWTTEHFPQGLAKFRLNSTPDCYKTEIASDGWTFSGGVLSEAKLGLAQLSNRLLVPPDGLVFQQAAGQRLLGYGWIALPFIPAMTSSLGVATGNQSWTLLFNTANFTGPVAFYVPETYSAVHALNGTASYGLDNRNTHVHSASIELGTTRSIVATDSGGTHYARIPRIMVPVDSQGRGLLIQDMHKYSKAALWDGVAAWMAGGAPVTQIVASGVSSPVLTSDQISLSIRGVNGVDTAAFNTARFTTPGGGQAFGMRWGKGLEAGVFPEYYKMVNGSWTPVPAAAVPRTTWLKDQVFAAASPTTIPPLVTTPGSTFGSSSWAAGPFTTTLSDGSTVQYVWYKFIDQPAIVRLGLSMATRDSLQAFVEAFHDQMGLSGVTFAPPTSGTLVSLDPTQFVTPPAGLTRGYVPIVIRQQ
ncbi:MAG TPA: Ig-like domain-containing protein [Gemmatimonadaceae bacterium]